MRVNAETKQATRDRILASAQELFAQDGFDSTTTRDIARAAEIGVGTLFNYFPTKESLACCLISDAWEQAAQSFAANHSTGPADGDAESPSLEEDLFAQIAVLLRKLKPFRKYLPAVLETSLSPLATDAAGEASLRVAHLEAVSQIITRHGQGEAVTSVSLQLYWTLLAGVLASWAKDASTRQQNTLALLDQSLAMYVGWLTAAGSPAATAASTRSASPSPRKSR